MKVCKPNQCPKCGSGNVAAITLDSGPDPDALDNKCYWRMRCRDCKTCYCEIYTLVFNGSEYEDQDGSDGSPPIYVPPEEDPDRKNVE